MSTYDSSSYKLIYIFSIPDDAHKGMVKVGEATIHTTATLDELQPNCELLRQAAENDRIKNYTFTAGIKVNLHWAELAIRIKEDILFGCKITKIDGFRDHDVHNVLKNSSISVAYPNGIKNKEWFLCDEETAKNAIKAVKEYKDFLSEADKSHKFPEPKIKLREEQEEAVEKTLNIFKTGNKMLWNAKMRFGKTLTAYELIRRGKFQKTLVVTHRPVVGSGWEEDHGKLFGKDSTHVFMKKQDQYFTQDYYDYSSDLINENALKNAKARGDYFTYFASMQDLRGSIRAGGKFNKNNAVFDMDWDLIIYDEAHEGTQTELGQTVQTLLESAKEGKTPKVLELSGTPYNIMDKYDDNVYTWDYVMEQRAKEEWDFKHPGERNPYEDLPKMNIFTFDMSEAMPTSYRYETEKEAFNFREFFRTWTGDAEKDYRPVPQGAKIGDFVHEEDVFAFLNLITTESKDTKYPFATDEFRKEFKHTFWMVPGVKEAKALSALLKRHSVFSHYQIVNVAGEGDEELPYDNALSIVQEAIAKNPYTITISCGKLTTGVTVKEWTAVMMLTGGATTDAKGYMQTIFRVQSAGQIDGKQKENCYVFDFAPDRALRVISESHQLQKHGLASDGKHKDVLVLFMNYCPIIAISGTKMEPYNANSLMRQIKRISVDAAIKSGFEDDSLYKVDAGMVLDEKDKEFFAALQARLNAHAKSKKETKVVITDNGFSDEDLKKVKKIERKPAKDLTPEERALREKYKEQKKQQQAFFALLRNISIRLPLLIYGADVPLTENITMEMFTDIVDDESWEEFLPKDVTKDLFKRSIKYFDEDVLIGAGLRIRRLVKQADEYPPTERIKRITELFGHFRNPDKETVLTPWRVVNMHLSDTIGGYCFLNEQFDSKEPLEEPRFVDQGKVTADLFQKNNVKVLEINSKSGLYPLYVAYSIYRSRLPKKESDMTLEEQNAIWNQVIAENVFVLCKTRMAKAITQRTLAGFGGAKTNAHYQPHLLEKMQEDQSWVVRKIKNPATWGKVGESMEFDAIVGNPPYQDSTSVNNRYGAVYNFYYDLAETLSNKYSLISPARFLFNTGLTPKEWNKKMLSNEHLNIVRFEEDATSIFPNTDIKGGIAIVQYDYSENYGAIGEFIPNKILKNISSHFIKDNENGFSSIVFSGRSDLKFTDKFLQDFPQSIEDRIKAIQEDHPNVTELSPNEEYELKSSTFKVLPYAFYDSEPRDVAHRYFKLIGLVDGKRYYKWIKEEYMSPRYQTNNIYAYKVLLPESNGSGVLGETLSTPIVVGPMESSTPTFISIGNFENRIEAEFLLKYIKSKFVRTLLGILKKTQHNPSSVWAYVPMQNFTENSDIDWSKSIPEIDAQLYKKYNLSPDEISFIESMIKPME